MAVGGRQSPADVAGISRGLVPIGEAHRPAGIGADPIEPALVELGTDIVEDRRCDPLRLGGGDQHGDDSAERCPDEHGRSTSSSSSSCEDVGGVDLRVVIARAAGRGRSGRGRENPGAITRNRPA